MSINKLIFVYLCLWRSYFQCCLVFQGPEVLNKYIGASEQAVRDLFTKYVFFCVLGVGSPVLTVWDFSGATHNFLFAF